MRDVAEADELGVVHERDSDAPSLKNVVDPKYHVEHPIPAVLVELEQDVTQAELEPAELEENEDLPSR